MADSSRPRLFAIAVVFCLAFWLGVFLLVQYLT
jgi:hypothetical protein